jgi:hypothetical protein
VPVSCSTTALTGADGLVTFKPAGVKHCLKDFSDFPAGTSITVPGDHDFQINDPVTFTVDGAGKLDTGLTASTKYFVVAKTATTISVSATKGGTAITLTGDGGTGTADTAGHINIGFNEFELVCMVQEWSMDFSREEIDTTTLPCSVGAASKYASFRTTQPGYASGSGTMSVLFTAEQASISSRLIANSLLKSQAGAAVKLYVKAVEGVGSVIDDTLSSYIEAPISLGGFSVSANTSDALVASINFNLSGPPTHLFNLSLV